MKRKLFLLLLIFSSLHFTQRSRLTSLGGLSFSVEDVDYDLTPFNFAGNPAWLFVDEKENYLDISPTLSNSWGNYHRKYDSDGTMIYTTSFKGIKPLGELGTFLGYTSYSYEIRRNFNRSLKKNPYAGESFFFVDTTSGNFRYNGPEVMLMYSWEPISKLYFGGSASYQIIDGLKKIYTYAKTIYRNVGVQFGVAYQPVQDLIIGSNIVLFDEQESIQVEDVNLLEVEVFKYRGENYFIYSRGSQVNHKIRTKGESYNTQIYFRPINKIEIAIASTISPSRKKILVPFSSFDELEEGYTNYLDFSSKLACRYKISNQLLFGVMGNYSDNKSWSKLSQRNLLLWEWQVKQINLGIGLSYKFKLFPVMLAAEYEIGFLSTDSSKYIDNRISEKQFNQNSVRIGAEYLLSDKLAIRFGYNIALKDFDIYGGGENFTQNKIILGLSLPFEDFSVTGNVEYSKASLENLNFHRSSIGWNIYLRLNSF
jgi:hypothetical protein